jgi:hypothetical protein
MAKRKAPTIKMPKLKSYKVKAMKAKTVKGLKNFKAYTRKFK